MKNLRLESLLAPRSIALVGASQQPNVAGSDMILELLVCGYPGRLYAVNPKYDQVEGVPCYGSLGELPEAVDLAVLAVPNERLEDQLSQAIRHGARATVIFGSARLAGDTGPPLVERLRARAAEARLPVCGCNCMGFYNLTDRVRVYPFHRPWPLEAGGITYISHSGSALSALLWTDRKLRFDLAISPGQELTTTVADYMHYALARPSTRLIALLIETVRDPEGFVAALDEAYARDVPVLALKLGRTAESRRFALSHSGAIAGEHDTYEALFERHGAVPVRSLDEMATTALLMSKAPRPGPGGVAAILDSGGERELLMDLAADAGVPFARPSAETVCRLTEQLEPGLEPANPLDAWGTGNRYEPIFETCWNALMADPDTALGLFVADLAPGYFLHEAFARICRRAAARCGKPVAVLKNHAGTDGHDLALRLTHAGIPVLEGTEAALVAVRHAFAYRDGRARPPLAPPAPPPAEVRERWRARLQAGGVLEEAEGLALLDDYGIPTAEVRLAGDAEGVLAAAEALGYPVALKTAAPGILHKSDAGGVRLDLGDADALLDAYRQLAERLGPRVAVMTMAPGRAELALGIIDGAPFGPAVLIAAGGTQVEVLRDRQIALAPFDRETARRLIDRLAMRPQLDAHRGRPPCHLDAAAEAAARLSVLAVELGDLIAELDVNPLRLDAQGCAAVDALVVPHRPDPHHQATYQEADMSPDRFKALVLDQAGGKTAAQVRELTLEDLPDEDVLVAVDYSSLNYKDGLAVTGKGKIVRSFPMVPGVDLAGTVEASRAADFRPSDRVVLTGWGVGERHWGGYSQRARLKPEWLVALPEGLDSREAMAIGTAGLTAMLCVMALEEGGVGPDPQRPVLVTGASGGVGSFAVALLAGLGHTVAAVTGRPEGAEYLRSLGAAQVVGREEMARQARPLEAQRWGGAVDTTGSTILARVLAETHYGGTVAACGLAAGADLPTTVMPFILRGVRLQGVDSVQCPLARRREAWGRLVRDLPRAALGEIGQVATLAEVPRLAEEIVAGRVRGRVVVDPNA